MADDQSPQNSAPAGDHIDLNDAAQVERWAKRLDATPEQIKGAVQRVGSAAADVEMDLKGTHATTNADQEARAESDPKLR